MKQLRNKERKKTRKKGRENERRNEKHGAENRHEITKGTTRKERKKNRQREYAAPDGIDERIYTCVTSKDSVIGTHVLQVGDLTSEPKSFQSNFFRKNECVASKSMYHLTHSISVLFWIGTCCLDSQPSPEFPFMEISCVTVVDIASRLRPLMVIPASCKEN